MSIKYFIILALSLVLLNSSCVEREGSKITIDFTPKSEEILSKTPVEICEDNTKKALEEKGRLFPVKPSVIEFLEIKEFNEFNDFKEYVRRNFVLYYIYHENEKESNIFTFKTDLKHFYASVGVIETPQGDATLRYFIIHLCDDDGNIV